MGEGGKVEGGNGRTKGWSGQRRQGDDQFVAHL